VPFDKLRTEEKAEKNRVRESSFDMIKNEVEGKK